MPMRLDPPRVSGPPTTSKSKISAPQAEFKLSSFNHIRQQYSPISHSYSHKHQTVKQPTDRETDNLATSSHIHNADQTDQPYSCFVPTLRQRYHPYFQKEWVTKRRKIPHRKSSNSLVDTSTDEKFKFLGLPFNNVLAYTAFIYDDNGNYDAKHVNSYQTEVPNFKNQRKRDTQEEYRQTTLQTKIARKKFINNNLSETTTCVVLPGEYYIDAFKSTRIIASETRVERFFNETDVCEENFSHIKSKRKKTPSRSHCCYKDKDSSTNDFRNDKSDYLFKSRRRNKNKRNPHTALLSKSTIHESRESKLSLFKDTNPYFSKNKKTKERNFLGNTLFFILYFMALPMLCSTNPSAQVSSALAQKSPLSRNEDYMQRNGSFMAHQYIASNNLRQGQQQVVQERQKAHPYNEYTWEVNQINPWLSACDLAGPAPADLQGSCGPPEVPKYCPFPCRPKSPGDSNAAFREVIERLELVSDKIKKRKSRSWSSMKRPMGDINERGSNRGGRKSRADTSPGNGVAPEQCLFYLEESHKRDICRDDFGRGSPLSFLTPRENRYWFTSGLRLRHCCEHAVVNALTPGKDGPLEDVLNGGKKCVDALDKLLLVDALAARLHCEFEEVLARYDCGQSYSVIHNCTHCKEAYRKWVCSSLVPYFAHGGPLELESTQISWAGKRLRPCRSFCQSVEQRCPYLLPGDRAPAYPTQYAGEPTFLCQDPNIPETGEQSVRALHGDEKNECCFRVCSENEPGLGICANCTDQKPHGSVVISDPSTAPHCEINPVTISSGKGGQHQKQIELNVVGSSSSPLDQQQQPQSQSQQPQSFCGTGGVGTMISSSSPSTASPSIPILYLFWVWGVFIPICTSQTTITWCLVLEILVKALPTSLATNHRHFRRCIHLRTRDRVAHPIIKFAINGTKGVYLAIFRHGMMMMKCWCRRWLYWWWWWSWRWKSGDLCFRLNQVTNNNNNNNININSNRQRKPRCQRCPRRNCEFGWQPRRRRRRKRRKKRFCASCHHFGFDLDRSTSWRNPS
ncbi:uncharacterized protein LOC127279661 [Leptopilina boulardi]|uniref:uncharacterized protein LOC127279661 n=1 Tax=Leptopilina boulardi TaxID=63433 RepID=UPI0021F5DF46|nr:uncharacterized protein LOC127279661 [Leptopilina boulardi]